jgi:hypothetical protein
LRIEPNQQEKMASVENLIRWRQELKQLSDTIMNVREEFRARFEQANKYRADGDEAKKCLQDIKNDERRYWQLIAQLPSVEDFTDEEVEKRNKRASTFLDIAAEIASLHVWVERKVEKLEFLSKYPSQ